MSSLMSMYIAEGFSEDCEDLMYRCKQLKKVTYDKFAVIWKEMNFSTIFYGRKFCTEAAELSQEVLHIGKRYMVRNTNNFEESVAGLFLVYGLLHLQPFRRFASLCLVPEDVAAIKKIEDTARRNRRIDALYILGSVLIHGPCQYQAELREYGLELPLKKYREGGLGLERQEAKPKGVFNRLSDEHNLIKEMSERNKLYAQSKAFFNKGKHVDVNLNYADKNLPTELETSLHEIINGLYMDDEKNKDGQDDHGITAQDIKARAMKNAVGSMRHLTGVAERAKSKRGKPAASKETDKTKLKCDNKPNLGDLIGKKRSAINRSFKYKKKRKDINDGPTKLPDDCISIDSDDEDIDLNSSVTNRIVIDSVNRSEELATENQIVLEIDQSATNVDVDLIPVVIHPGSSFKEIEFEIIDQCNNTELNYQQQKHTSGSPQEEPEVFKLKVSTKVYPAKKRKVSYMSCTDETANVSKDDGSPKPQPDGASTIDDSNSTKKRNVLTCTDEKGNVSQDDGSPKPQPDVVSTIDESNSRKKSKVLTCTDKKAKVSKDDGSPKPLPDGTSTIDDSNSNVHRLRSQKLKSKSADVSSEAKTCDKANVSKDDGSPKLLPDGGSTIDESNSTVHCLRSQRLKSKSADVSSESNIVGNTTKENSKKTKKSISKKK